MVHLYKRERVIYKDKKGEYIKLKGKKFYTNILGTNRQITYEGKHGEKHIYTYFSEQYGKMYFSEIIK